MTQWKQYPRTVLAGLLLVHVLAHIDRNILMGFSSQITTDLALSNAQYGFLVGAVWVLSFGVMATVAGSLADRYSRPRVMAVGLAIWSLCTAGSGLAHGFLGLSTARFFVASGEAALVPAAVALITEIFPEQRRGTALGIFFTGIPIGIGCSFLLAGHLGEALGWRHTFFTLGAVGLLALGPLLLLRESRRESPRMAGSLDDHLHGTLVGRQVLEVFRHLRTHSAVMRTSIGFVLVHMGFVTLAFTQLWLVRERGLDASGISKTLGLLQLGFGLLGSVLGGAFSDRLARRLPGGHCGVLAVLVILCMPLIIASRLASAGSTLMYVGLCANAFLPLAVYGPALGVIQGRSPAHLRATVTGVQMMAINVFAIALGNLALGALSDALVQFGYPHALTVTLLTGDFLALLALPLFVGAARRRGDAGPAVATPAVPN